MMFTPRPKTIGSENFLKLADKEQVTGIFKGDIYTFKRHWTNDRSSECTGANCIACKLESEKNALEKDPKKRAFATFRFRVNFLTFRGDKLFPKVLEGGTRLYDMLQELDKKCDLAKTLVEITRHGTGTGSIYIPQALTQQPVTKEMQKQIESMPLLPLAMSEITV